MKKPLALFCLVACLAMAVTLSAAEYRLIFETAKDWDETLYDWKVDVGPAGVRLLRTELIADEMGVITGGMKEVVLGQVQIKKEFLLDQVQAESALLLVHANTYNPDEFVRQGGFLWVDVNGHPIRLELDIPRMLTGGWVRCDVPASYLVPGLNSVVLRNETKAPFYASVEASRLPNRSAKSLDGGKTWDYQRLGKDGFIDGEYVIRLRLARYPAEGEILSDFIEAASLVSENPIKPAVAIRRIAIELDKAAPPGTSISLSLRGGQTPAYAPEEWTLWRSISDISEADYKSWRFFQWRARLQTSDRRQTPLLRKLTVRAEVEVVRQKDQAVRVAAADNMKIVRGYYPFAFQDAAEPRLEVLRNRYRLDEVVAHCSSEFDQFRVLAFWMRGIWRDGWGKHSLELHTPWDALISLELSPQYKASGMCVIYSNTFIQCALAVGLQARGVVLDHHFVSEVWSNEHRKWVTFDIAASTDSLRSAFHIKDNTPLCSLETHTLAREGKKDQVWIVPAGPFPRVNGADQKKEKMLGPDEWEARFGMPFRNNYLTSWLPGELEHGFIQYHYDGYLWWKDTPIPKYEEYTYQSSHPRDFYWTINHARVFLGATARPAELRVQLDTVTPNFAGFRVRVDGGEWNESDADFSWTLHSGTNTLEVKPVNAFRKDGVISVIRIEY
jgi:hypothetical protein